MNDDLTMWNDKFYNKDYTKKHPELTLKRAKEIGDEIGVDWDLVDLGEWIQGLKEELEHVGVLGGEKTAVIPAGDLVSSGRIAYEHLLEVPTYYSRLEKMEHEGEDDHPDEEAAKAWVKKNREKYQELWDSAS
ncbi:MAG: hypothetical protein QG623_393 [Patescibacteria group bacterium]|nr:hypothetical protein [Patescibacteria group bacterium]